MKVLDEESLRAAMLVELRSAWEKLRSDHPGERFYAFGLYTDDMASSLGTTASTEEGLEKVAAKYASQSGGEMHLHRASLRWSPCDSPLHSEAVEMMPRSQQIRDAGPDPYEEDPDEANSTDTVLEIAFDSLAALDDEGVFGTGAAREALTLNVWMGDQADEDRVEFAAHLNPDAVVERLDREQIEAADAFETLSEQED